MKSYGLLGGQFLNCQQTEFLQKEMFSVCFFYFKNGPMKKEKHVNFNGAIAEMVLAAVQEEWDKAGIIVQRKDKVKAKILK